MTLPVMATIFEYFYRDDRSTTTAWEKLSRIGPLWALAAFYLTIRTLILGGVASVLMRPNLSWHDTLLSSVSLLGGYIGKLIWPAHFAAFYVFHPSRHFTDARCLAWRGRPGGLRRFISLALEARAPSLVRIFPDLSAAGARPQRALDARKRIRGTLPVSAFGGILLAVAMGRGKTLESRRAAASLKPLARAVPVLVGVLALVYAVRTVTRNRDWTSDEVLFRQALQSQGDASLVRSDLGSVFYNHGNLAQAEREWQEALSYGPTNVFAMDNMALLRQHQHRYIESLDYSWRALRGRARVHHGARQSRRNAGRPGPRRRSRMAIPHRHLADSSFDARAQRLRQIPV